MSKLDPILDPIKKFVRSCLMLAGGVFFFIIACAFLPIIFRKNNPSPHSPPSPPPPGPTSAQIAIEKYRQQKITNLVEAIRHSEGTEREEKLKSLLSLDPNNDSFPEELASIREKQAKWAKELEATKKELEEARQRQEAANGARAAREKRLDDSFSKWDNSHKGLVAYIKERMNDPDSFKHVETTYTDRGDHLTVKMVYRGKNGFGGVITSSVRVKTDLDGKVLEVLETGNR